VVAAIVVGLVLLLVARPLSSWLRSCGFAFRGASRSFVVGRSAGAVHCAGDVSVVAGVADSHRLLNIVFMLVVVFTLVQGPALADRAVAGPDFPRSHPRDPSRRRTLDMLDAELLTMTCKRRPNCTRHHLRTPATDQP